MYGYKTGPHSAISVRSYSQESVEAAVDQTRVLPLKERIPRLPLAITAISVIPFITCSIIPFAFPFEYATTVI